MRLELEVCKWLSPTDLLLCVSPLSQAWHQASLSDEVWKPLLDLHFPLQTAVEVRTMCQFRAFSEASYLPVIYQNTLYRLHLNGRMDKLDLKSGKPHRWWTFTSLLTIGVLPSFQLFIHLPESALAIILDPSNNLETELPNLLEERMTPGICVTPCSVYLFGGSECDIGFFNAVATCEKLNLKESKWTRVPDLRNTRASSGALWKEKIYFPSRDLIEVLDTTCDQYLPPIPVAGLVEGPALAWLDCLLLPGREFLLFSDIQGTPGVTRLSEVGKGCMHAVCLAIESVLICGVSEEYRHLKVWKVVYGTSGFESRETDVDFDSNKDH